MSDDRSGDQTMVLWGIVAIAVLAVARITYGPMFSPFTLIWSRYSFTMSAYTLPGVSAPMSLPWTLFVLHRTGEGTVVFLCVPGRFEVFLDQGHGRRVGRGVAGLPAFAVHSQMGKAPGVRRDRREARHRRG